MLVDDDLRFEDGRGQRVTTVVNSWLCELPVSGAPSPKSWDAYARVLKAWLQFLEERDLGVFGSRPTLRLALSAYAGYRLAGPLGVRWKDSTWNLHIAVLTRFYEWAVGEGYAEEIPFSFAVARRLTEDGLVEVRRNLAKVRTAKPHARIKYLEPDFVDLLVRVLDGLLPDGTPDPRFRGQNPARNTAMTRLVLSSGLRRQEFTHLLVYEVPPLPSERTPLPISLPVAAAIAKGGKQRTTWVSYEALDAVHSYIRLERALAVDDSTWQPDARLGPPLIVTKADRSGGIVNGRRVAWSSVTPGERLRLVSDAGGTVLLGARGNGAPFVDWATVFRRAADKIRARFEPRYPHVRPHRLRHTMAMTTLQMLVAGYYRKAARLVADTDDDPAMALYLTQADPLTLLRDLLGHSSVRTTEVYLSRLDMSRVFAEACADAGREAGLQDEALAEADAEFDEDDAPMAIV